MKDDKKKADKKKKKEDQDEEINEGAQDDINEVDDSFGLPDVDFKPLDEEDEEDSEEPAPAEEELEAPSEEDQPVEKEPETDAEPVADSGSPFGTIEDEFEDGKDEPEKETFTVDSLQDPPDEETPKFERKFEHPEQSSPVGKILIAIAGVIIIGGAIWYFAFYMPEKKEQEEQARQEQLERQKRQEELARQQEIERQEALALEQEQEQAAEEATMAPGEFRILTERTGRYYVVIGSFIDEDLAADLSGEIASDGVGSMILSPPQKGGFFRVALSDHPSWNDAQNAANGRKGAFGDSVWVLKY